MSEKRIKVPPPDPSEERLYSAAEKYKEELIKITRDLVAIESVTYDPEKYRNLQPIFDYVADYLEKIGFKYRYFYCPHLKDPANRDKLWPNLIAFYAPARAEKYIDLPDNLYTDDKLNSDVKIPDVRPFLQFNGHLDTVPFIAEKWSEGLHPLEPKVVGGRIYGRGSFDMKGGVACILVAARIFAENIEDPHGKLQLWFVPDEEINGNYGADFMSSRFREVVNADGTVITEPTAQSPLKSPAIIVGEKGIRWLRFRVYGAAGHGSVPKPKSNAINKALRFLAEIKKWKLPKVKPPLKKKDMLKFLLGRYSLRSLLSIVKQKEKRNIYDEDGSPLSAFFKTTVSFTKFRAGTKVNVIPDIAEFELDIRVLPGVTEQMLFDSLARYCTKLGYRLKLPEGYTNPQENNPKIMARPVDIEVSIIGSTVGTYENPDAPFMRTLGDVFESVYGVKRIYFFATGSTDAVHMRKNGIKNIAVFGPGGKNAHDADEYVEIDHLVKVTKVLAGLAYRMLKRQDGSNGFK